MTRLKIPHNAFVFVGDGRKALFLRNEGDEKFPNLKTESVFEDNNPPTHDKAASGQDASARRLTQVNGAPSSRSIGITLKSADLQERSLPQWSRCAGAKGAGSRRCRAVKNVG